MKKSSSNRSNSSGSRSGSSRRRARALQSSTASDESSTASDDSTGRDVVTILQQDDQELAEAKIRAKQELSQPQERMARNRDKTAPEASEGDVVLREDDQDPAEAKARAYDNGSSADNSNPSPTRPKSKKRPPRNIASSPTRAAPSEPLTQPSTPPPPQKEAKSLDDSSVSQKRRLDTASEHSHQIDFFKKNDSKQKEKAQAAADQQHSSPTRQYTNRTQAVAANLAFRDSQQDNSASMEEMIEEEEEEEEEKVEETFEDVLLEASSQPPGTVRGGGEPPAENIPPSRRIEPPESQPGAFRVGTTFNNSSQEEEEDDSDIHWGDESGSENNAGRSVLDDNDNMDQSQKSQDEDDEETPLTSQETAETVRSADGDILVEATLVSAEEGADPEKGREKEPVAIVPEPELVTAERMSDTEIGKSSYGRRWLLAIPLVVVVLIIVAVVIGLAVDRNNKRRNKPPEVTQAPTMAPTSFYFDVLPSSTQEAIEADGTPQALAYDWYQLEKSTIHNISESEMVNVTEEYPQFQTFVPVERFALATLYYATNGGFWIQDTNWLDHLMSACQWYSTFFGSICSAGPQTRRRQLRARELQDATTPQYYNRLSLSTNNLTGSFPPEVALLSYLDVLNIHHNDIGGSIPTEFGTFQHLTLFQVYKNHLNGTIPTEIGALPRVRQLNLAYNELTGTIPTELGQLGSSLLSLSASNNPIQGTLPTELGKLRQLSAMFFYKNPGITGPIPSQLGALTSMTELQLNTANYTGSLPSEIGLMTRLEKIYLHDNFNLHGTIPTEFGTLQNLNYLEMHNTNLTGTVPEGLCNLVVLGTLEGLTVDCNKVNCTCGCDCSASTNSSDHGGDEWDTQPPLWISPNETDWGDELEGTDPPIEDEGDEFITVDEGDEFITVPPVEFSPVPPCDYNETNSTNTSVSVMDCGDDFYIDDSYFGEPDENGPSSDGNPIPEHASAEVGEQGPTGEYEPNAGVDPGEQAEGQEGGELTDADILPEVVTVSGDDSDSDNPESEWTDPPEHFDETELAARRGSSNIFSHSS